MKESIEELRIRRLPPDEELLNHLAILESWHSIQAANPDIFTLDVALTDESRAVGYDGTRPADLVRVLDVVEYQRDHFNKHGVLASVADLEDHFEIVLYEPEKHIDQLIEELESRYLKNQWKDEVRARAQDLDDKDIRVIIGQQHRRLGELQESFLRHDGCIFSLEDVDDKPQEFLLYPYLPLGVFTLCQGQGGCGKSVLSIWMMTQVEGDVLIIGDEDTKERVKRRCIEASIDLSRVHMWDLDRFPLTLPSGERQFEAMIRAHNVKFVVLDTATEILDPKMKGTEADDVLKVITALRRVAVRTSTAILGIGHSNRNDSGDSYKRIGGSIAWFNRSKSAMMLGEDPVEENTVHLYHTKHNYSPEGEPLVFERLASESDEVYLELVGESELEFHEVFNPKAKKPTKTEMVVEFFDEWANRLPVELDRLRADFNERYAELDISERVLDRGRKTRCWDTKRVGGVSWIGTPASFKDWTPPGESEPLSAAERIKGRRG